jgi:hypothetical protein
MAGQAVGLQDRIDIVLKADLLTAPRDENSNRQKRKVLVFAEPHAGLLKLILKNIRYVWL